MILGKIDRGFCEPIPRFERWQTHGGSPIGPLGSRALGVSAFGGRRQWQPFSAVRPLAGLMQRLSVVILMRAIRRCFMAAVRTADHHVVATTGIDVAWSASQSQRREKQPLAARPQGHCGGSQTIPEKIRHGLLQRRRMIKVRKPCERRHVTTGLRRRQCFGVSGMHASSMRMRCLVRSMYRNFARR